MRLPFRRSKSRPIISPVLTLDALGFGKRIDQCKDPESLSSLAAELDAQFHRFRSKIPFEAMLVGRKRVIGTREFSTLRVNDMFVLFSERGRKDLPLRYLITASLTYHQLLLSGFIVRGGLGFGPILRHRDLFVGYGFLDAYRMSEDRVGNIRDICAILVSPSFFDQVSWSERCCRLLCLYKDHFFIHPNELTDPDLGEFNDDRILRCLREAGANKQKLSATKHFLENFEDYDTALLPNSRASQLTQWTKGSLEEPSPNDAVGSQSRFDDWPSVWRELARIQGREYMPPER